jgi:hypothetical protein
MFKSIIAAIKGIKKVQSVLDAIDDDIDKDGTAEYLELKEKCEEAVKLGKQLFVVGKDIFLLALSIFNHVKEA